MVNENEQLALRERVDGFQRSRRDASVGFSNAAPYLCVSNRLFEEADTAPGASKISLNEALSVRREALSGVRRRLDRRCRDARVMHAHPGHQ